MQLLIDLGNTSLKWALWDGESLSATASARHGGAVPIDVLAAWDQIEDVDAVRIATVASANLNHTVASVCQARWGKRPEPITAAMLAERSPVRIAYQDSQRLGIDRWLGMLAAHDQHVGPKLVVDAGSAITYDILLGDGRHLGGLILPGVTLMRDSLLAGTEIPSHELAVGADLDWATDTGGAIASACIQAPAALTERIWDRLRARAGGEDPTLILTGGDAERLLPAIVRPVTHRAELVLEGLALYS
jgi:type III pantothenate kinase